MRPRLCLLSVLFIVVITAPIARAQQTAPATSAPASQPTTAASQRSVTEAISGTGIGQILSGEKTLTMDDVLSLEFWSDNIKDLVVTLVAFVPRLIGTLVFLLVFWLIYRGIRRVAMGSMKKGEVDSSIRDLLGALINWAVMGFGVVIACNQLGIPIVAMLTGVSIIGLAVGFAAQETLANFIAGIVIFLDKPFRVGDWITIDDTFGRVRRITFRATRILTLDGEMVVLPNTQLLSNKVVNHTTHPVLRVNVSIGIAYKESIDAARKALLALTEGDDRMVASPAPEVVVETCADSSVNLLLRFWIEDESIAAKIRLEYLERAKKALDGADIEIPYPHLQLFIENTPAIGKLSGLRTN